MVTRPVVVAVICVGLFIIINSLIPKTMAMRTSNMGDFRMENQRTHKRRNYIMQRAEKERLENLGNLGVTYDTDSLDSRNPEDLSAFIVDYANMIDDVFLLDKSVETRTRKRGNIKLEKHNNQVIPDPPCSCKTTKRAIELGANTFPKNVDIFVCDESSQHGCPAPNKCKEIYFNMPILRKRVSMYEISPSELLPQNLNVSWVAGFKKISVGCECARDYKFSTN